MKISPIPDVRALRIELVGESILAVADLHLGISAELAEKGIEIPSRIPEARERLLKIIHTEEPDRLFLLGDVKHNIPITSWEEWENLPPFFQDLREELRVEIVPGNHDGDIEGLIPKGVTLHGTEGTTLGDGRVGLIHGHAWPDPELLRTKTIVMGHNHPTIEFRDEGNARISEPAWVRTKLKPENLPDELQEKVEEEGPEVIIIPAFSKLIGGGIINRKIPEKLLGPLFTSNSIDLERAEISLLDGTYLGKLKDLQILDRE